MRAIESSGSLRGGTGRNACRLMTTTSGWDCDIGTDRRQQVAGHLHDLVGAHVGVGVPVAQADLGEAHTVGSAEEVLARIVHRRDADLQRREATHRERERLATRAARRRVERERVRVPAVERHVDLRDPAIATAVHRLHEVDVVGRDRRREPEADVLPDRLAQRGRAPGGLDVAVERAYGAVLRRVA